MLAALLTEVDCGGDEQFPNTDSSFRQFGLSGGFDRSRDGCRLEPNEHFVPAQGTWREWWIVSRPLGCVFTLQALRG